MADSATGFEPNFDPTIYSPSPTPSPVAGRDRGMSELNLRSRAVGSDQSPAPDIASLVQQGTTRQNMGQEAEAEELFRQALAIADRTMGPENPELMLLLTDLARLHLRKSSFAAAEPLLHRLLDLKRSKGEDHPEVATVLANLANVRQALGHHESAEQLWRRVLDIRERTLAPNHFAIATALEHLGDSCAARGKIVEALSGFQRALSIRERTLGPEHPSLRVSREKIADLQLLASEDSLDTLTPGEPVIAPDRYRLTSGGESMALATQPPVFREKRPTPAPRKPPQVIIHSTLTDIGDVDKAPAKSDAPKLEMTSPLVEAAAVTTAAHGEPLPYRDALESLRAELEQPYKSGSISERVADLLAPALNFVGKKEVIAGGVAIVLALLLLGVLTGTHALGEGGQTTAFASPSAEIPRVNPPAATASSVTPGPALTAMTNEAAGAAKAAPTRSRAVEERPSASKKAPEKAPEKKSETKSLTLPTLSSAVLSRLDSVASRASASARPGDVVVTPSNTFGNRRSTFGESEQPTAPQRARLIGDLPTPRIPNQVADVEGEVRVRFSVDTNGLPVMSTFEVVTSPNPLLTTAVRKVIPGMRFEPARTGGSEPRPIADIVQIAFRFAAAQR